MPPRHNDNGHFHSSSTTKGVSQFAVRRLENDNNFANLDQRNRSFARLMVATVERRQGQIDTIIKQFIAKKDHRFRKVCDVRL